MKMEIYSKKKLISLYQELRQRIGKKPTKRQWLGDANTPSDMPVRMNFGNWTEFVKECGDTPYKPYFTLEALANRNRAHKGKRSCNWKGGKIKDRFGYILIWNPKHPNAKLAGYIHEHRFVVSKKLGRPLTSNEYVHHKNGIKHDNRLSNLELVTKKVHLGKVECPHCGKEFSIR